MFVVFNSDINDQSYQSYDSILNSDWDSLNLSSSTFTDNIDSTSSTQEQDRNIRNWMSNSNVKNNTADRDSRSSYVSAMNSSYNLGVGNGDDFELFGSNLDSSSGYYGIDSTLPDLIPDENPFSISNPSTTTSKPTRPNYSRSDRSSSLPPLSSKKLPKRRTLESSHQSSFLTSLYGYDNTLGGGVGEDGRSNSGSSNDSINDDNNSLFGVGLNSGTSSKRGGEYFNSHTDSPLTREEQEDLLDRVRRDLLGVNLDTLRGPLRALALSAVQPTTTSSFSYNDDLSPSLLPLPTTTNHRNSLALPNLIGEESEVRKTVSPQEAFLDYDSVDQQLQLNHQSKNRSSSTTSSNNYGIGIGSSLFAPLPLPRSINTTPKSPTIISSPLSPRLSSNSTSTLGRRVSHPFSVPKNAVSWTSKPSSPIITLPAVIVNKPLPASAPGLVKEEETIKPFHLGRASTSLPSPTPATLPTSTSTHVAGKTIRRTSRTPIPRLLSEVEATPEESESELSDIEEVEPIKMTSALQFPSSSRATNFAPAPILSPSTNTIVATTTGFTKQSKKRKRSRVIAHSDAEQDSDNDAEDPEYHSSNSSHSTTPHHHPHTTTSSRGRKPNVASHRSQPQTKRRRRSSSNLPSTPSTSSSSTNNSIACPFILENGEKCNIIFRRPYDLSRHRETIHGEILPGRIGSGLAGTGTGSGSGGKTVTVAGNGRVVVPGRIDWICFECKGSFSRKDALLRHTRIRNHRAFESDPAY